MLPCIIGVGIDSDEPLLILWLLDIDSDEPPLLGWLLGIVDPEDFDSSALLGEP